MRKLSVGCLAALDGVIGSPERWAFPFFDEECVEYSMEQLADVDLFLLGRVAYQELSARWSGVQGNPYLDRINALPKLVASTTLKDVGWNASLVDGDIARQLPRQRSSQARTSLSMASASLIGPWSSIAWLTNIKSGSCRPGWAMANGSSNSSIPLNLSSTCLAPIAFATAY